MSDESNARRPRRDLTGAQRRKLRGLAHHLSPIVQIGKDGIDAAVEEAVARALLDHELIKVRVLESSPLGRSEAAEQLASRVGAHVVGEIGRIVILYRRHPEKPKVPLPQAGT